MSREFRLGSAPHLPATNTVQRVMLKVLLALLPGIALSTWWLGPGVLLQIAIAVAFALAIEAVLLRWRGRPLRPFLTDLSAPLAAVLFALCLPPWAPWWIAAVGMLAAIGLAKHLYGGLGHNVFNPAMVGYALVLVAFTRELSAWPSIALPLDALLSGVFGGAAPVGRTGAGHAAGPPARPARPGPHGGRGAGQPRGGLRRAVDRIGVWALGRPLAAAAAGDPVAGAGRRIRRRARAGAAAVAVRRRQPRVAVVPSYPWRACAGRLLHRHRSGQRRGHAARAAGVRLRGRRAGGAGAHLRHLPGRRRLRRAADERGRAAARPCAAARAASRRPR